MTEFFTRKAIYKQSKNVIVNDGDDKTTAKVSHLEQRDNGELVELSTKEALRKKQRQNIIEGKNTRDLQKLVRDVDPGDGLGETPEWFEHVSKVVDWSYENLLLEVSHLQKNAYFVRDFKGDTESGSEFLAFLEPLYNGSDRLVLNVAAEYEYTADSQMELEELDVDTVDGVITVDIDYKEVEDEETGEVARYPDFDVDYTVSEDVFGDRGVRSGTREILVAVALKHGYDGEALYFDKSEKGDQVVIDVLNKDFCVVFSRDESEPVSVLPGWAETLFLVDGCPLSPRSVEVEV